MWGYRRSSHFCAYRRWLRVLRPDFARFSEYGEEKIVIFDENELNTKLFHDLRELKGYGIIETRNGMEALKITRVQMPES